MRRLKTSQKNFLILALFSVVGIVFGGVSSTLSLSNHKTIKVSNNLVFLNSAHFNIDGQLGVADIVDGFFQLPPAPPGRKYNVWLLPTQLTNKSGLLIGSVSIQGDHGTLHYHEAKNENLFAKYSRVIITNSISSQEPSLSDSILFSGLISNVQNAIDVKHYSLLDHLRHLLATDPGLDALGLHGGLGVWLFWDTQKVLQTALSAQKNWHQNSNNLKQNIIELLEYLESINGFKFIVPNAPVLISPIMGQVGLLVDSPNTGKSVALPSLLNHIASHLYGLAQSPGVTERQKLLANQINNLLTSVNQSLQRVLADSQQLYQFSNTQLQNQSVSSLLNDLKTNAMQAETVVEKVYQTMQQLSQIQINNQ